MPVENRIRKDSSPQPNQSKTIVFLLLLPAMVCREHTHLWRADHDDWHILASVHQPTLVLLRWLGPWKYKNRDGFPSLVLNTHSLYYRHATKGKSHLLCTIWLISMSLTRRYLKYSGKGVECTDSSMELDEETASTLNSAEVSKRCSRHCLCSFNIGSLSYTYTKHLWVRTCSMLKNHLSFIPLSHS